MDEQINALTSNRSLLGNVIEVTNLWKKPFKNVRSQTLIFKIQTFAFEIINKIQAVKETFFISRNFIVFVFLFGATIRDVSICWALILWPSGSLRLIQRRTNEVNHISSTAAMWERLKVWFAWKGGRIYDWMLIKQQLFPSSLNYGVTCITVATINAITKNFINNFIGKVWQ